MANLNRTRKPDMIRPELAIGCAGDLHCGGVTALLPPNFIDRAGNQVGQNFAQEYLWACWDHFCHKCWRYQMPAFIFNGDVIEGKNYKQGGIGCLPAPGDQRRAARGCIRHLLSGFDNPPKVYFMKGTPYHAGPDASDEEALAETVDQDAKIRHSLNLQIGDVMLNFAHHLSYAPINRSMPVLREVENMVKAEMRGNPHADVIVRSHVHYHIEVRTGFGKPIGLTLPAWQLPTGFQYRSTGYPNVNLGGGIIVVDPKDKGKTRIECELYEQPKQEVETVEVCW